MKTYLFISDNMFPHNSDSTSYKKNPDPQNGIVVYNVKCIPETSNKPAVYTYEYDGTEYCTSYALGLLENTPQNVQLLKERNELYLEFKKLKEQVQEKTEKMKFIG